MIGYIFLRIVGELFRLVPFRVVYMLSDGLAFLLFRVVGYRKKVVLENLQRAFPEKTEAEIVRIARLSYRNLTDVTLESIKSFTMSVEEANRRCPCLNSGVINQFLDKGQAVILTGSHYSNWEYTGLTMPPTFHGATVTAYKPLTNKIIDRFLNACRSRTGMELVSMDDMFRVMRKRVGEAAVYILLSDQSPSSRKSAHWVEFLGLDTASLPGADVMARKFKYPVLYYHVRRLRRGFYDVEFRMLCENPEEAEETGITRAYAKMLEAEIRAQPENWLWSHKRWKIRREG